MKFFSLFAIALCVVVCHAAPSAPAKKPEEPATYTTKFDNINLDEILASKRTMKNYMTCLTEGKLCSPEGTELRRVLPDALKTSCNKCTEKQKQGAIKVIKHIEKNYPEEWKKLLDKWDPKRTLIETLKRDHKEIWDQIFTN